jgi:hypothetical protein
MFGWPMDDVLPGNHRAVCHSIEKHLPGRGILALVTEGVGGYALIFAEILNE